MRNKRQLHKILLLTLAMLLLADLIPAQLPAYVEGAANRPDTADTPALSLPFRHRISVDLRPGYILPTNPFLRGENKDRRSIRNTFSAHLKYAFGFHPDTYTDRIYGGAYQGLGLAYYTFGERTQIGNPVALYLFQGARLAQLSRRLSFNYEWNFGLSAGWNPYNYWNNWYNRMLGSKINAYLNIGFYFGWMLSPSFDLITGIDLSHFSNGNTTIPNAGLNTTGLKIGLVYRLPSKDHPDVRPLYQPRIPAFPRHISYDLVLFGSWRRKGLTINNKQMASPDAYTVMGFNFAPMYNFSYKFKAGLSLDGIYDGSANVYAEENITPIGGGGQPYSFHSPSLSKQLALGLSGRFEYVMPYFTVGVGIGVNVVHRGGDLRGLYQILALKTEITRNLFIHIGYNLQNFQNPNYLMLGIGVRFHNRSPRVTPLIF